KQQRPEDDASVVRRKQEQGGESEGKDRDVQDNDTTATAAIGTWEYDQWYVLNGIQLRQDVSYELKVAFPLETPINVDLDVSVWTLE
ncbi:hypothetical protein BGX26_007476, partial [Mortierella sp. AD094]